MFGYVKPFKPHLRICEFETYRAVYCGLCKTLGRIYGIAARMTLSYDFAFLGLMALALNDSPAEVCKCRCIAHPFKRSPCMVSEEGLEYTASAASILIHHKIKDDKNDRKFLGKIGPMIMLRVTKKAYSAAADRSLIIAEAACIGIAAHISSAAFLHMSEGGIIFRVIRLHSASLFKI